MFTMVPRAASSAARRGGRIRLCHVTATLAGGGLEERIARITRAMDPGKFEVTWVGLGRPENDLPNRVGGRTRVISVPKRKSGVEPQLVLRLAAQLARIRPDVVHVHNWSASLYGIVAARLAGTPVVLYGEGGRDDPRGPSKRRRAVMRALAPHVDHFTSVCDFLGGELRRDWNVPAAAVTTLRTGVDAPAHPVSREALRQRFHLPASARIAVVSAGRFRAVKQLDALVAAFARIAPRFPDAALLLLGDPLGTGAALEAAAGREHPWLRVGGHQQDVTALLPACDLALNTSRFEGASNGVLEAMAAGLPVLATAVGGTPELVQDGVTGRLLPADPGPAWEEALAAAFGDPERTAHWGRAGQARAQTQFSGTQMVNAYASLYEAAAEWVPPGFLPRAFLGCARSALAIAS
jgi:glycosyltransferase involved in cell wall biosynthesis